MKYLQGDNQFFGINHADHAKGKSDVNKFLDDTYLCEFINEVKTLGANGLMINSNKRIKNLVTKGVFPFDESFECHYSLPYPHDYAQTINKKGFGYGMIRHFLKATKLFSASNFKFLATGNVRHLVYTFIKRENVDALPKRSVVYMQNIFTDLLQALKRFDIILEYCKQIKNMGHTPGLITLNPTVLADVIKHNSSLKPLVICYNFNSSGFNIFPNIEKVKEATINLKGMGIGINFMSVMSSGLNTTVESSLAFALNENPNFITVGSGNLANIRNNINTIKGLKENTI